ncbi:TfuA-like protein [Antarcticirhabdus aurantiaca]|uniref:TfuA-like protein n=1 Tax=Antarcticirhabdus aurantiaca TaxID=2606717 RepID=A0ACD4NNJ8_9HYPH|nr:TfuA-like protein [Antarcticirhabdus aurantiaca]WAJ28461.1 TfuA-like protein [Jeongeuplla avenae]
MTKVLFAGPSLHGVGDLPADLVRRPPAAHGDIQAAVLAGANVVGLADGLFETVAAVWHKEILFALSQGVSVLGAASMGALRAAECREFGMVAVGEVARRYVEGELDDDAAVAQLHAPAELDFMPLTVALVDCQDMVEALHGAGLLDARDAASVLEAARAMFFKERTWPALLAAADVDPTSAAAILALVRRRSGPKRRDAILLARSVAASPDVRRVDAAEWTLSRTPAWRRSLERAEGERPSMGIVAGPTTARFGEASTVTLR